MVLMTVVLKSKRNVKLKVKHLFILSHMTSLVPPLDERDLDLASSVGCKHILVILFLA